MIVRSFFLLMLMCWGSCSAFSAQLKSLAMKQENKQTSLFLTLDGPFTHKLFLLAHPDRAVIDLKGARLAAPVNQAALTNALLRHVRAGRADNNTLRLVLELSQKAQIRSAPWMPPGGSFGVRIDLITRYPVSLIKSTAPVKSMPSKRGARPQQLAAKSTPLPPVLAHRHPVKASTDRPRALRDVIVVLDAGHGGKDCGARGPHRSQEKDVVLAITLKLKRLIDQQPGMRAVLTRSGDYYVGLRERLDISRKYNGDVFVAIHADAFHNPHSNGASVFALSQRGATSEAARWLAEKENYSELGGVNLGELDDQNGVVRSVLIDLSQTATINAGLQMGGRVLSQLGSFTNLHNNRVEQARFVVLKSPDIPSILVETGFISNPREERNLTNPSYQLRLSRAIFQGIKEYFWEHPPHGSRIEAMAANRFHIVRAGDTLPAIAARYQVSLRQLQKTNRLGALGRLRPGQKLVIPAWA